MVANAEYDGLAYDAEGHVYVDTAITDAAVAARPFDAAAAARVGVCHFPTTARDPWQVHYITAAQPLAAALVKYGDFLAPPREAMRYGYGCLLYGHFCDFSTQEPCNQQGICQSNNTCFCDNEFATCAPLDSTNGCETNIGNDTNNCGFCAYQCPLASDVCCSGVCADLQTSSTNCGQCGFFCVSLPNVQTAQCTNGNCIATCLSAALTQCQTGQGPFCANLQTDPNYCGSCVNPCPSDKNGRGTRICQAGVCGIICLRQYPNQCGTSGNSNCVNLATDIQNCGTCGNVCPTDANALTSCNNGRCTFACQGQYTQCTNANGNIFCAQLQQDNNNCGTCNYSCSSGLSCVYGVCTNALVGRRLQALPAGQPDVLALPAA
ncbi:hypothetical protein WJX81_006436 [Elliptochloris bilobata]|uniref:Uncharacterized protein n=1 Tax=Elliptochloris bilobata TaxID=381761 RepID=A0AAW1RGG9_9CHLO